MGNEKKLKHLEFIQGIINRMGNNSFLIKGWCITLVVGIFAITITNDNYLFLLISIIPTVTFWYLDGFFLKTEKLYRELYKNVAGTEEEKIDFLMNVNKAEYKKKVGSVLQVMFSKTLLPFYGMLLIVLGIFISLVYFKILTI